MQDFWNQNQNQDHSRLLITEPHPNDCSSPKCGFSGSVEIDEKAEICTVCLSPLVKTLESKSKEESQSKKVKKSETPFSEVPKTKVKKFRNHKSKAKTSKLNLKPLLNLANSTKSKLISESAQSELKKPLNLIGLLAVVLGMSLWVNQIVSLQAKEEEIEKTTNIATNKFKTSTVQGLYNYGGAPVFAPLVSNGLDMGIENQSPGLAMRFGKPMDQNFSDSNALQMLLNEDLSIAFAGRGATVPEYEEAAIRNTKLQQVKFAIDAIVFFGNNNKPLSQLNQDQIEGIFTGTINNWNQIDPEASDLPIVPILTDKESLEQLGIEPSQVAMTSQYESNHTQVLRKVISTPGAVSFSSASLVKNQQLIEVFSIADGGSSDYVPAFIDDKPNLKAFKSSEYPLTRSLFIIYRDDEESQEQKLGEIYADYLLSEEGQKIVEDSGFLPVK